ncbi:MAG: outer membrane beta-barrel domain-containing protein [Gammaproteobacteria bacterium]|nr:MAG: outer membrane beta-barrel domain-containing protein [Gammaproteobacteria bacterium]
MESGLRFLLLNTVVTLSLAVMAGGCSRVVDTLDEPSAAEPVIDPRVERREVRRPRIDTENFELGVYTGFISVEDFGSSTVYGGRLAYHITEGLFAEATIGQTTAGRTSFETLSGSVDLLTPDERRFRYYDLSLGYNLFPGETFIGRNRAFTSSLYLLLGAGSTEFAGDSRFTISFGAGYRVLLNDWLSAHLMVRDHVFRTDLLGEDKTVHNIEFVIGLGWFF